MKKKISMPIITIILLSILLLYLILWQLLYIVLRDGQHHTEEFFLQRASQSLQIDSDQLRYLDGYCGRDPVVFLALSGEIPVTASVHHLRGLSKDHSAKIFNELAAKYHLPCVVGNDDELLNFKGESFDLYINKSIEGSYVLYFGF